jgi:histidine triad (HIT) family protein
VRLLSHWRSPRRPGPGRARIGTRLRASSAAAATEEPVHRLVLPVAHVRNLQDADSGLLAEIVTVIARLTAALPAKLGANGSFVFQNNVEPDGLPFHLHVHVVPRFDGDEFRVPDPGGVEEVPRTHRLAQARELGELLA